MLQCTTSNMYKFEADFQNLNICSKKKNLPSVGKLFSSSNYIKTKFVFKLSKITDTICQRYDGMIECLRQNGPSGSSG